jgi:hypothetical protein
MVNKTTIGFLVLCTLFLSACGPKTDTSTQINQQVPANTGSCQPEAVAIEGYGDKGKRLPSCFVEYPGEPTRQDKSYYIVEDICGQFTPEFIQNTLGKPVISTKPSEISSLYNCTYYLDASHKDYVMLVLDYLKFANQQIGQEAMGRKTEVSDKIPMRNMVVRQPDGLINSIYLVLGDDKFISIQRSSGTILTSDELINFAANIAKNIKNYK